MKAKHLIGGLLMATGIAVACNNFEFVGELFVGTVDSREDVAEELQEQYGDQFPEGTRIEAVVRFILKPPGSIMPVGTFSMPIIKECDETLDEAYDAQIATQTGGTGGGGYYFPGFPIRIPGGCVGNCTGTVTVGDVKPT